MKAYKNHSWTCIREYDQEMIKEIWEESGSSKKIHKALMQGQNLFPAIKSRTTNEKLFVRDEIAKEATEFYREFYIYGLWKGRRGNQ